MDLYRASAIGGPRCSVLAGRLDEPLAGTSAVASTWLCIEQPGPWGREALLESHLEQVVGRELAERAKGTGVRIAMIRRPGNHPDRHRPTPHRIYVAHTRPGRSWLERGRVADVKELLDLDFAAAGAGEPTGYGEPVTEPLLLVCTNGRRDVCCALLGRPVAAALFATHGEQAWECSHLGGHRFSPTAVLLPHGYSYGRLDVLAAERLLAPDAGVLIERCRGRSTWSPAGQVADLAVRWAISDRDPDGVRVAEVRPDGAGRWLVTVSHVDGRRWAVPVVERTSAELRSASCGAKPTPMTVLDVDGRPELI
ncbi:MAG TPA: sucrase ferredoxin [Actinophytocola sp.]|uniref:sucrase ferredoxin n=1 Tax=Actinophytocola sp. TaxID=1872138 RepID=UPI002DDCEC8F|nr:sucrase ferredoxin [Actinophytocola sp.]HEV2780259.1 sucrase ferredoxin [Actinophytocola sp.]